MLIDKAKSMKSCNYKRLWMIILFIIIAKFNAFSYSNGDLIQVGNYTYRIISTTSKTTEIAFYDGTATNISIPTSVVLNGTTYKIKGIGEYAFSYNEQLKEVHIGSNIEYISEDAFVCCTSLEKVYMENGVKHIVSWAFHGCNSMKEMHIPSSVTQIDYPTPFGDVTGTLYLGCNMPDFEVNEDPFSGSSFNKLIIEEGVQNIGSYSFHRVFFKEISFPTTLKKIGDFAFSHCDDLETLILPEGLQYIGDYVFYVYKSNLSEVIIPSSVTHIGVQAFPKSAKNPITISVANGNSKYDSRDNCNAIIETATNTLIWGNEKTIIPQGIKVLARYAFGGCSLFEELEIPTSVEHIGEYALTVVGLEKIHIPGSIKDLGPYAVFLDAVPSLDLCTVKEIIIDEGCETIGKWALAQHGNLHKISLPSTIKSIDSAAFGYYKNLQTFYCLATTPPNLLADDVFLKSSISTATLYVPEDAVESYKKAAQWKEFGKIEAIQEPTSLAYSFIYNNWSSSNNSANSSSSATYSFKTMSGNELSFDWIVSSEKNYDKLTVALDGVTILTKSGEESGTFTYNFENDGVHTIVAKYTKDNSVSSGEDKACILNFQIKNYKKGKKIGDLLLEENNVWGFACPETSTANSIQYSRRFNNNSWQALYVPFSININDWQNDFDIAAINMFHQYDDDEDGMFDRIDMEVKAIKSGTLKPNHPYLIRAKVPGEKTISVSNAILYETQENSFEVNSMENTYTFTGTYHTIPGTEMVANNYYAMGGGTLHKADDEAYGLGAFRWYLKIESRDGQVIENYPNEVRIKVFGFDDDITGIEETEAENHDYKTYDLNGREISGNIQPGIYIRNGKKIIVK